MYSKQERQMNKRVESMAALDVWEFFCIHSFFSFWLTHSIHPQCSRQWHHLNSFPLNGSNRRRREEILTILRINNNNNKIVLLSMSFVSYLIDLIVIVARLIVAVWEAIILYRTNRLWMPVIFSYVNYQYLFNMIWHVISIRIVTFCGYSRCWFMLSFQTHTYSTVQYTVHAHCGCIQLTQKRNTLAHCNWMEKFNQTPIWRL